MSADHSAARAADDLAEKVTEARLATLSMLVAGLAHELNTPLGALNSNHDLLRRALQKLQDILADEVVEPHELDEVRRIVRAVDGILRVNDMAVERMGSLVSSLRNFGRLDRAERDVVDVHEGLESTLAILAHQLQRVEIVREYGDVPKIECWAQQLNQVFMNLLLNAAQAMPQGGRITIRTTAAGDTVEIGIADTGSGIRPEHLARIFDPGFTTKGGRIGMGLGLLISRRIVEQHGGRLLVESIPGQGASFTVRLPVRSGSATRAPDEARTPSAETGS